MPVLTPLQSMPRRLDVSWRKPDSSYVLNMPAADQLVYSNQLVDRSGNANHGAITGATWTKLSSGRWVLSFDGTDDKVIPGAHSGTLTAITFKAWVNVLAAFTTSYRKIIHTVADDFYVYTDLTSGKWVSFPGTVATQAPVVGTYSCVVVTVGGGFVKLFVNGVQLFTPAATISLVNPTFNIGVQAEENSQFWKGTIGLLSIRSTAITPTQVIAEFNQERHLFGV